jgi:purine-cytosine permease-like protein
VSDSTVPQYRTGTLWGVLALFLFVGSLAAAFFVYGVTSFLSTGEWLPFLPVAIAAAIVASVTMLLITGILYKVDRLRGTPTRRIGLFD